MNILIRDVILIVALLKQTSHDDSAASTLLADEFDLLCVSNTVPYHERCFTKLGYASVSLVHAMLSLQDDNRNCS